MRSKLAGIVIATCWLLTLVACRSEKTSEQLQEEYAGGVAALRNQYYYKVQLAGGHAFWFVPSKDALTDIRFYANEQEAKKQALTTYGAGFFITSDGVLVAQDKVVNPRVNTSDVCRALANQLSYLKQYYVAELEFYKRRLLLVENGFGELADDRLELLRYLGTNVKARAELEQDYRTRKNKLTAMQTDFKQKVDSLKGVINELDHYNNSEVSISPIQRLEAAVLRPDGQSYAPYRPCTLQAANDTLGLAVVRLKDGKTPEDSYIFDITSGEDFFLRLFGREKPDNFLYIVGIDGDYQDVRKLRPYVQRVEAAPSADNTRLIYKQSVKAGGDGAAVVNTYGRLIGVNSSGNAADGTPGYCLRIENLMKLVKVNYR